MDNSDLVQLLTDYFDKYLVGICVVDIFIFLVLSLIFLVIFMAYYDKSKRLERKRIEEEVKKEYESRNIS